MTRSEKIQARKLESKIEAIFNEHANGVQINIMDLPKIMQAGRIAAAKNGDITAAIIHAITQFRQN